MELRCQNCLLFPKILVKLVPEYRGGTEAQSVHFLGTLFALMTKIVLFFLKLSYVLGHYLLIKLVCYSSEKYHL